MADAQGALRASAYDVLSDLYLRGVTAEVVPLLMDVPDLVDFLVDPVEGDEWAAEHHRLFELQVLPYASVFLEADARLGGDVTALVQRRLVDAGLPRPTSEPADHLGRELQLMAALAGAPTPDDALAFLDGHLLWWLPGFVAALDRNGDPFWRTVGGLTLDLVIDHRQELLRERGGGAPSGSAVPRNLRGVEPSPLEDTKVGLREIAAFVMLPARSGLYLSEADVRAMGKKESLPGGFGSRVLVLETLFRSAVAYGALGAVLGGLSGYVGQVRGMLGDLADGKRIPEAFLTPWTRRLDVTERMLEEMMESDPHFSTRHE